MSPPRLISMSSPSSVSQSVSAPAGAMSPACESSPHRLRSARGRPPALVGPISAGLPEPSSHAEQADHVDPGAPHRGRDGPDALGLRDGPRRGLLRGAHRSQPPRDLADLVSRPPARRARGAGAHRSTFAFTKGPAAAAYSDEDATFYFPDGLARQPRPVVEA